MVTLSPNAISSASPVLQETLHSDHFTVVYLFSPKFALTNLNTMPIVGPGAPPECHMLLWHLRPQSRWKGVATPGPWGGASARQSGWPRVWPVSLLCGQCPSHTGYEDPGRHPALWTSAVRLPGTALSQGEKSNLSYGLKVCRWGQRCQPQE